MHSLSTQMAAKRRSLRQTLRVSRAAIPTQTAAAAAAAACGWLTSSSEFHTARGIAGYIPVRGELDPRPVLNAALGSGKSVFLPRIKDAGVIEFVAWTPDSTMAPNRFGIPEPQSPGVAVAEPEFLDLVLVPLIGFDAQGTRLGTGAGYYDRAFAFKRRRVQSPPVLAGYAYALQQCNKLDAADWDVPLDMVVTESGIIRFREPGTAR